MRPTTSLTARGNIRPQSPVSSMGADIRRAEACCANDLPDRDIVAEPAMIVIKPRRFISLTNYGTVPLQALISAHPQHLRPTLNQMLGNTSCSCKMYFHD